MQTRKIIIFLLLGFIISTSSVLAQGWFHPGIDIQPQSANVTNNLVYTTHAGFVTYAGPAPAWQEEKGWIVQVETDFNRDNVADVITRYTHLFPNALMVNDVHYRREVYTPEFFAEYAATHPLGTIPYGNGPYVTRNQLIGIVGDSGSPGHRQIQYEIVTSRYNSLMTMGLKDDPQVYTGLCDDSPYEEACSEDASSPGLFFAINLDKSNIVKAPNYINPGIVTPQPARRPKIINVREVVTPELPEPPLPRPKYIPKPPPITEVPTPTPAPPIPITITPSQDCSVATGVKFNVNIVPADVSAQLGAPPGMCGWYISIWPTDTIGSMSHVGIHGQIGGAGIEAPDHTGPWDCGPEIANQCGAPMSWIGSSQAVIEQVAVVNETVGCPASYWDRCGHKYYPGQGPGGVPSWVNCNGVTAITFTTSQGNTACGG